MWQGKIWVGYSTMNGVTFREQRREGEMGYRYARKKRASTDVGERRKKEGTE